MPARSWQTVMQGVNRARHGNRALLIEDSRKVACRRSSPHGAVTRCIHYGNRRFLPGEPIPNDRMEDFIGRIGGRLSSIGQTVLRCNGINTRHYALTPDGEALDSNASMLPVRLCQGIPAASRRLLSRRRLGWVTGTPSGNHCRGLCQSDGNHRRGVRSQRASCSAG